MAHCPSAPPVNVSSQLKMSVWADDLRLASPTRSTPGSGIWAMRRLTNTNPSVIKIFLRSSGMRNTFENPFIIDILSLAPYSKITWKLYQKSGISFKVALESLLLEGVALVVEGLAAADAELDLDPSVLEVDLERNQGESLRLRLELELADLLGMDEKLAHRLWLVVEPVAELVGGDVDSDKPKFAAQDRPVAARQRNLAVTDGFDLGPRKLNTALEALEHGIIMSRLAVLGEDRIELLFGHQSANSEFTFMCFAFHFVLASSALAMASKSISAISLPSATSRSATSHLSSSSDSGLTSGFEPLMSSRSRMEMRFTRTGVEGNLSWAFFKSSLFISAISPLRSAYYSKLFHFAVGFDRFFIRQGVAVAAGLEFGAKAPVNAFRDATGRHFRLLLRDFVDHKLPGGTGFRTCLAAEPAAGNEHDGLGIGEALVHHRRVLAVRVARDSRAVGALGRDEVLDAVFVADDVNRDPVRKVEPLPVEAKLADRGMLRDQDALLPLRARLAGALVPPDRRARRVRDLAPRPLHLHELDACHAPIISFTVLKSAYEPMLLVTVQHLDAIRGVPAAAKEPVNGGRSVGRDDAFDEPHHRGRDPEARNEHRDARRIRHEELRGDASDRLLDRHEFAVAKRRVVRQHDRLARHRLVHRRRPGPRRRTPDQLAVEPAHAEEVLEVRLHRTRGQQEENGHRRRLLPLDVGLPKRLFEGHAGRRAPEHQDKLEWILEIALVRPVGAAAGDVLERRETLVLRTLAGRRDTRLELRNPFEAFVDEFHALEPHVDARDVQGREEGIVRRGRVPVAQELSKVMGEFLPGAVAVQRETLAEPPELRRRVVLQQRLEPGRDMDHRRLRERRKRLVRRLHGEVGAGHLVDGVVAAGDVRLRVLARIEGMEIEIGRPRLVRIEEDSRLLAEPADLPDRIQDAFVGAGRQDEKPRTDRRLAKRALDVLVRLRAPHPESTVPAARQVARDGTGHDDRVMDRLVAVAVHEHGLARLQERHQHRLVRSRRAVGDVRAERGAENLGGELLRLGKRRMHLGRGEVSERLDGHREVRPEDHRPESLVKAREKRRAREGVAAVVPGRVPALAGLDLDVLLHRVPKPRQPERLEEMDESLAVPLGMAEHRDRLLGPAPRRKRHRLAPGPGHRDLGNGGDVGLEPLGEGNSVDMEGHHRVVQEERAPVAPALGHSLAGVAAFKERLRQRVRNADGAKFQRRILERHPDVEGIVAELPKRVGEPVFNKGHVLRVTRRGFVQPQDREGPHIADYTTRTGISERRSSPCASARR